MSSNNPVSTTWGTTKGMLKKLQLREISRDKKLSVFLWFVAALIVIGIYWYYRAQIKKERRDLRNQSKKNGLKSRKKKKKKNIKK